MQQSEKLQTCTVGHVRLTSAAPSGGYSRRIALSIYLRISVKPLIHFTLQKVSSHYKLHNMNG